MTVHPRVRRRFPPTQKGNATALGKGKLLRLGFNLPQIGPAAGPEAIISVAGAAEDMGFATLWVADRLLSDSLPEVYHNALDPVGTLTFAAARTTRVGLGSGMG